MITVLLTCLAGAGAIAPVAVPFAPNPSLRSILKLDAAGQAAFDALPEHAKDLFNSAADAGKLGSTEQIKEFMALNLAADQLELLLQDNCVLCHTNPDNQEPRTLFSLNPSEHDSPAHMNLSEFVADEHFRRGLMCSGCHGGTDTVTEMVPEIYARWPKADARARDKSWIPGFCARCHADPAFMRQFNPSLPTDQLAKYQTSKHGELVLVKKDPKAAQCTSCHGIHSIQGPKSRTSWVYPQKVPFTCGKCHGDADHMAGYKLADGSPLPTNQLTLYKDSVHGQALLGRGDLGAPACNSCHGNHAAMPPRISSVAQVCRTCHAQNGGLFDSSRHKLAFEKHGWPECEKCHGSHGVQKPQDSWIGASAGTLCHDCHSQYATTNQRCDATAAEFRTKLDALQEGYGLYSKLAAKVADDGLDAEPLSQTVVELEDSLRQARSRIHSFDVSEFSQVATPGLSNVTKAKALYDDAQSEYRFRRMGLAVAIAIMIFVALVLYLKIRTLKD